jgi:hypothetical protein
LPPEAEAEAEKEDAEEEEEEEEDDEDEDKEEEEDEEEEEEEEEIIAVNSELNSCDCTFVKSENFLTSDCWTKAVMRVTDHASIHVATGMGLVIVEGRSERG